MRLRRDGDPGRRPRMRGAALAHYLVAAAALAGMTAVAAAVVSALGGHLGRFLQVLALP